MQFINTLLLFGVSLLLAEQRPEFGKKSSALQPQSQQQTDVRSAENAVANLDIEEGLEVKLFASEPEISNPLRIDVDDRGRVWVIESKIYRGMVNGHAGRNVKDRILILEDTDGDGVADITKVFYDGSELNAPQGIWVMGNKAIVSQSPYVWLLTDTDGDDRADKKEVLFKGIGGVQDDQGVHSFVFGPDGNFYFSYGNKGRQLVDGKNRALVDKYDIPINFRKYKHAVVFRCDQNFRKVEILGENFFTAPEVAVDSYGSIWVSDREEDTVGAVRLNFVMENGNFGYADQATDRSWRIDRTNLEADVAKRHWHQNDPGIIPNVTEMGTGFPMGMTVYEGKLLPRKYWDQILLSDAGAQGLRGFTLKNDGAGYTAEHSMIIDGKRDNWFRPSDVCVAPDGSLIVSDWYDPVIGNHRMKDREKGRLFRVAPPGTPYKIPVYDYTDPASMVEALQNPNLSVRYKAWNAIVKTGKPAEPYLEELFTNYLADPKLKARALWALNKIEGVSPRCFENSFRAMNPNLKITVLRVVRQRNSDPIEHIKRLESDSDPQVRRECLIALFRNHTYEAKDAWIRLAKRYDGMDRWYLEALGIGAYNQWEKLFPAWIENAGAEPGDTQAGRDIVWRARTNRAIPYLTAMATDQLEDVKARQRYFRAFDLLPAGYAKTRALIDIARQTASQDVETQKLALKHLPSDYVRASFMGGAELQKVLDETYGTSDYIDLIELYVPNTENERLLKLAESQPMEQVGKDAGRLLLHIAGDNYFWERMKERDEEGQSALMASIRGVGNRQSCNLLAFIAMDNAQPLRIRKDAARFLCGSWEGEDLAVRLIKDRKFTGEVKEAAEAELRNAFRDVVRKSSVITQDSIKATEEEEEF